MTALVPNNNGMTGTLPIVSPAPRRLDREALAPRWAQLAAVAVTILAGVAAGLLAAMPGAVWVAIPLATLSVAVTLGAFLPDVIARRWDRADEQGAPGSL